jgi:hypothetical protein
LHGLAESRAVLQRAEPGVAERSVLAIKTRVEWREERVLLTGENEGMREAGSAKRRRDEKRQFESVGKADTD